MVNSKKCAIIGCGFVGASSAFSLMESGMFNEMVLIDVNKDNVTSPIHSKCMYPLFVLIITLYVKNYTNSSLLQFIIIWYYIFIFTILK